MPCIDCPKLFQCHDETLEDLKMIREVEDNFKLRKMPQAEGSLKKYINHLVKRHEQRSGR